MVSSPAVSAAASRQTVSRKTPILTGAGMGPGGSGFGQVRPRDIYRGGSGYGVACHIRWAAWGGPLAVGIGTAWYVAPGAATAGGHWALAVVVLYRLGSWHHRPAYTRYRWYFPEGGSLSGGGVEDCLT